MASALPCSGVLMWLGSGSVGMPLFQREARARIGSSVTPSIMVKAIASSMWECSTACTSGRAFRISMWIGISLGGWPSPSSTLPS